MARTTIEARFSNLQSCKAAVERTLTKNNYKSITENNESVWKNGKGFWTAMKYIKIEFSENNTVLISGWIRPAGGSEQDLNGVIAALPKKQVMNVIKELQTSIK